MHCYFFLSECYTSCVTLRHTHILYAQACSHHTKCFHSCSPNPPLPPDAATSKKKPVSWNEAWDHFADGWLIPQIYQPDQYSIYCLLISALRAALLSCRKKNRFTTKILAMLVPFVCVCVLPYGCEGSSAPIETLWIHLNTLCDWVYMYEFTHFPQLAFNELFMLNKVRCCKDQM